MKDTDGLFEGVAQVGMPGGKSWAVEVSWRGVGLPTFHDLPSGVVFLKVEMGPPILDDERSVTWRQAGENCNRECRLTRVSAASEPRPDTEITHK